MKVQMRVTKLSKGYWHGPNGERFCDLRTYFDIPNNQRVVYLCVSDKPHRQAYELTVNGARFIRKNQEEGFFFVETERWMKAAYMHGLKYLTLEC